MRSALSSFLREKGITIPRSNDWSMRNLQSDAPEAPVDDAPEVTQEPTPVEPVVVKVQRKRKQKESSREIEEKITTDSVAPRHNFTSKKDSIYWKICENCSRRFHYTIKSTICSACATFPSKKKKKTSESIKQLTSLKDLCIKLIAENINNVDQFGDLSVDVKMKISKIISRQRKLDQNTLDLFLDPLETILELYDCSRLSSDNLLKIPLLCPRLTSLSLGFCGRITDSVVYEIAKLPHLKSLELHGCYLVSNEAFNALFKLPLVHLSLSNAVKLVDVTQLVENCPNLSSLKLKRCTSLVSLEKLGNLENLQVFKLIEPSDQVGDTILIPLLHKIAPKLIELSLSKIHGATSECLSALTKCTRLEKLCLKEGDWTDEGILQLFTNGACNLKKLDLSSIFNLKDATIVAALNSSMETLEELNISRIDEADFSLKQIKCPRLKHLNISWIKCVDDELFKVICEANPSISVIEVYGCHRLTRFALSLDWQNLVIKGNEFD